MADTSKFINDPKARKKRTEEKRQLILEFISGETFSTTEIIAKVLGVSRQAAHKTLKAMEKEELIKLYDVDFELAQTGKQTIWGLTPTGALLAIDENSPDFKVDYFEVGRVAAGTLAHSVAVQKVRATGMLKSWKDWIAGRKLRQMAVKDRATWLQVPDAVATSPSGVVTAFEVERSVKTPKRYEEILSSYAEMHLDRTVGEVLYICPEKIAPRLKRLFENIQSMVVKGNIMPVHENVRKKIRFLTYEEWEKS